MHNANPDSIVSWADFLIGYGPWAAPIARHEPEYLPGHNSSYNHGRRPFPQPAGTSLSFQGVENRDFEAGQGQRR